MRPAVPLPSLPLWLAATLALVADAAILAGLVVWTATARIEAPAAPIEVSLVAAAELEPAAPEPSATPPADEPPQPEPEPPEPPPPPAPSPPEPDAIQPPEPPRPPPPKPRPKPRPVQVAKPKPRPPAPVAAAKPIRAAPAAAGRGPASAPAPGPSQTRAPVSAGPAEGPTSPAAYLSNPAPGYPDAARRQRQQGTVLLRVLVSAEGRAVEVQLAQSSGVSSLDEAALRAVRRWRFTPARQRGQAITAWVRVPIRFSLGR